MGLKLKKRSFLCSLLFYSFYSTLGVFPDRLNRPIATLMVAVSVWFSGSIQIPTNPNSTNTSLVSIHVQVQNTPKIFVDKSRFSLPTLVIVGAM